MVSIKKNVIFLWNILLFVTAAAAVAAAEIVNTGETQEIEGFQGQKLTLSCRDIWASSPEKCWFTRYVLIYLII